MADLVALLAHPLTRSLLEAAQLVRKRSTCSVCKEPIGDEPSHIQIDRIGQHHLRCCGLRKPPSTTCLLTEMAREFLRKERSR